MTLVSKTPINDIFYRYMCLNVCITCIDEVKQFTNFFDICKYYLFFILENHSLFSFYHFLSIRFFFNHLILKFGHFILNLQDFPSVFFLFRKSHLLKLYNVCNNQKLEAYDFCNVCW